MKRRTLMISAAALGFAPAAPARSREFHQPGLVEAAMAAGEVLVVDFWASWCSTCAAQQRVLSALKAENPDYERRIRFVTVDWDAHGRGDLARALAIPRRSTLVALDGQTEIGRIVAGTARAEIAALLDAALRAAAA